MQIFTTCSHLELPCATWSLWCWVYKGSWMCDTYWRPLSENGSLSVWRSPRCPAPACAGAPGSVGSGCAGCPQPAGGSHGAHKPAWSPDSGLPATERSSPQRRGLQLGDAPLRCLPPAGPAPPPRVPSPPAPGPKPPGTERRHCGPAWVPEEQLDIVRNTEPGRQPDFTWYQLWLQQEVTQIFIFR